MSLSKTRRTICTFIELVTKRYISKGLYYILSVIQTISLLAPICVWLSTFPYFANLTIIKCIPNINYHCVAVVCTTIKFALPIHNKKLCAFNLNLFDAIHTGPFLAYILLCICAYIVDTSHNNDMLLTVAKHFKVDIIPFAMYFATQIISSNRYMKQFPEKFNIETIFLNNESSLLSFTIYAYTQFAIFLLCDNIVLYDTLIVGIICYIIFVINGNKSKQIFNNICDGEINHDSILLLCWFCLKLAFHFIQIIIYVTSSRDDYVFILGHLSCIYVFVNAVTKISNYMMRELVKVYNEAEQIVDGQMTN